MKFFRITFVLLPVLFATQVFSQNAPVKYSDKKGTWTFTAYNANVIKTTFQPFGYIHNEQISNAVIEKPSTVKIRFPNVEVFDNKDGRIRYMHSGKKLLVLDYFD